MPYTIGIDLGTTHSCVAVYKNKKVEIIQNDHGNRTTPSFVSFSDREVLVGNAAKNQAARNPTNTVYDAKRLIGRTYDDDNVKSDKKLWPFKVIDKDSKPMIQVEYKKKTKVLAPEEISAMVLVKIKESAEAFLNEKVKNAVITVPAYFNNSQRLATKNAGRIAGLNVVRIINEPTAAALAYGLGKQGRDEETVLIYDLGGGTFDVTIMKIKHGKFEVKATAGDTQLGGGDFDTRLVIHFAAEFKKKTGKSLLGDFRAVRKLRTECERAKAQLSFQEQVCLEVDSLFDGEDFYTSITRASFEELCFDLFQKTMKPVEQALTDAFLIDQVVLVGGSTRIPEVQALLSKFFDGKDLNKSVHPDEAVAYGAAIQAAILSGDISEELNGLVLVDVTPLSLGIGVKNEIRNSDRHMSIIIPRNTPIPTRKTKTVWTSIDYQEEGFVFVYEGESASTEENHFLGEFELTNLPKKLKGEVKVNVTFDIDANGILTVTAVETSTNNTNSVTITSLRNGLSEEDIQRMIRKANEYKK